MMQLGIPS